MTSATSINQHKRRMPLELRGFAAFYAMGRSDAKIRPVTRFGASSGR